MKALWNDECGAVTTIELLIYGTIAGLGIVAGVTNLRNAVVVEFSELANAILHLNQGFSVGGTSSTCAATGTSIADDGTEPTLVSLTLCTSAGGCTVDTGATP